MILSYGILGPIIIVALFVIFNLFAFPTFFFIIISGYLYGLFYGFITGWAGMIVGIALSFINTRYLFRKDFNKNFGENKTVIYLEKLIEKYHGWAVIFLRVFFIVPYNVQNITYGLTKIKGLLYVVCSALGVFPITLFYAYLGTLLGTGKMKVEEVKNISLEIMIIITVIATLIFMTLHIIKKLKVKNTEVK